MLKEFIKKPRMLVRLLFDKSLTPTQEEILKDIFFEINKRICIIAMTRYGKSMTIALSVLLYVIFNPGKKVILIAPRYEQARILMDWVGKFILRHSFVSNQVDIELSGLERLKKEVTKKRITFKNGSEIRILSAEGTGERLMGFGADLVVEDESWDITDEVYRTRITRMLGDNPDARYIGIGNPFPGNHFEDNWNDPRFKQYRIGHELALKEKRVTAEFLAEQKSKLTPIEYTILYEAEFPKEAEDSLLMRSWLTKFMERPVPARNPNNKIFIGCDIASMGMDLTILTVIEYDETNNFYIERETKSFSRQDTMTTTGWILELDSKWKANKILVDVIGVGTGVVDRLNEQDIGTKVLDVNVGKSPLSKREGRFLNVKAEMFFHLRSIFEKQIIATQSKRPELVDQLHKMKFHFTSNKKIRILDPGERPGKPDSKQKSPDFADALALALYATQAVGKVALLEDDGTIFGK